MSTKSEILLERVRAATADVLSSCRAGMPPVQDAGQSPQPRQIADKLATAARGAYYADTPQQGKFANDDLAHRTELLITSSASVIPSVKCCI